MSATTGFTQDGGGSKSQVSFVAGTDFSDDRGSIMIGGTWMKNNPICFHQRYDKHTNISSPANPANTGPADGIPDRVIRYNIRSEETTSALQSLMRISSAVFALPKQTPWTLTK